MRRPLTAEAQEWVAQILAAGDTAVDATVGNGHDTLFLAHHVGTAGRVYGFDPQPAALETARARLAEAGVLGRVWLHPFGHEHMATALPPECAGRLRAVMFNLGYLPGGDKSRTTLPATTLAALTAAVDGLAPAGRISLIAYTGHAGGRAEAEAVKDWLCGLSPVIRWSVEVPVGRASSPPELIRIERLAPRP